MRNVFEMNKSQFAHVNNEVFDGARRGITSNLHFNTSPKWSYRNKIATIKRSHAAWVMAMAWMLLPAAKEPREEDVAVEGARFVGVQALEGEASLHVQGVAFDDKQHVLVTSVDMGKQKGYLDQLDRATGYLLKRLDVTDKPRYPGDRVRYHAGGFSISGHSIWVPVAEYTGHSSAVLEEIDSETLQKTGREYRLPDHLGCVAASDHYLIAANWGSEQFYIIDLTGKEPMRVVDNPSSTHYQDMKIINGKLFASGNIDWTSGAVDWRRGTIDTIDIQSMKIQQTVHTWPISGFNSITGEGMAIEDEGLKDDDLYLLPLPGLLFHYKIDKKYVVFGRNGKSALAAFMLG